MSNITQDKDSQAFIESDCVLNFNGCEFSSGGAYLLKRKETGKLEGLLYMYQEKTSEPYTDKYGRKYGASYRYYVGTWDGSQKVNAITGKEWLSNFGDKRQSIWFSWNGLYFYGIWYKSNSDIVRCRQITQKSYYS